MQKLFNKYIDELYLGMKQIPYNDIEKSIKQIVKTIKNKNNIFICGNGGSAAISNHYVCDFLKLVREKTNFKPKIYSLSNSMELITAISNDFNYKDIFSYQIDSYSKKGDLLIIISSSGNSRNILKALKASKKNKMVSISFTGFRGGIAKKISDISVHLKLNNYGQSEDGHHILMHFIMEEVIRKLKTKS